MGLKGSPVTYCCWQGGGHGIQPLLSKRNVCFCGAHTVHFPLCCCPCPQLAHERHAAADELAHQALEKAVKDARDKAEILARAAGRELGEAMQINAQGYNVPGPVPMRAAMAKEDASQSYRPGEQDVTASVQITFQLN